MDSYELRSEILSGNTKYYIQSNWVAVQSAVVTSLFFEGSLLSKQVEHVDTSQYGSDLRGRVREIHEERKLRITSLMEIRQSLKKAVDGRAHLKLGEAFFRQRLFRESMAEVIRAIKLGVEESRAYQILGGSLTALGDYEKALKSYRKAIEIAPEYPDVHNAVGITMLKLENCREAVAAFEKALELNKYYAEAFLNLAIALSLNVVRKQDYEMSRGLQKRMREILQMCLQLKPSLETDFFRAARTAVEEERWETVHRNLQQIRDDQDAYAQSDLSLELYLILKFQAESLTEEDVDRYIARVESALDANPGYADLKNDLGILYTAKCKIFIDKANSAFRQSLEINPDFRKAEKNLKLAVNDRQGIHFLLKALLD